MQRTGSSHVSLLFFSSFPFSSGGEQPPLAVFSTLPRVIISFRLGLIALRRRTETVAPDVGVFLPFGAKSIASFIFESFSPFSRRQLYGTFFVLSLDESRRQFRPLPAGRGIWRGFFLLPERILRASQSLPLLRRGPFLRAYFEEPNGYDRDRWCLLVRRMRCITLFPSSFVLVAYRPSPGFFLFCLICRGVFSPHCMISGVNFCRFSQPR